MLKIKTVIQVVLVSLAVSGHAAAAKERATYDALATNAKVARAYQSAIKYFVDELELRAKSDTSKATEFMSSLINYRSELRADKDGYCIDFSPKEFEGSPVMGGTITYCFDESGASLISTTESR